MTGRPIKNTVEYFPHYVGFGKTIFILQNRFGNDGYAVWFKILELLSRSENHYFWVRNSTEREFLVAITGVTDDILEQILSLLAEVEAIDAELWSIKVIWCENLVKNLAPVYQKRNRKIPSKPDKNLFTDTKTGISGTETGISGTETTQSKVEYSKEKEKEKEKEISVSNESVPPEKNFWTELNKFKISEAKKGYDLIVTEPFNFEGQELANNIEAYGVDKLIRAVPKYIAFIQENGLGWQWKGYNGFNMKCKDIIAKFPKKQPEKIDDNHFLWKAYKQLNCFGYNPKEVDVAYFLIDSSKSTPEQRTQLKELQAKLKREYYEKNQEVNVPNRNI